MNKRKIVINKCWGGFGLSRKALHRLRELGNKCALEETDIGEKWGDDNGEVREDWLDTFCRDIPRDDPLLIQVIEELGDEANGSHAKLKIVKIPVDVKWEIDDYDGMESVEEAHRSWG